MLVRMLWAAFSVSLAIRPLRASTSSRSTSTRITSAFSTARTMTTRTAFTHTSRTGTSNMRTRTAASSSVFCWTAAASLAMMSSAHSPPHSTSLAHSHSYSHSYSYCQEAESKEQEEEEDSNYNSNANAIISTPPFPETALTFDHYNGATLDLGLLPFVEDNIATDTDTDTTAGAGAGAGAGDTINDTERKATLLKTCFPKDLANALTFWRAEGRKGIWIRVPVEKADLVPHCVALGFQFHSVKDHVLLLSQWLPTESVSRLPLGPTHQIGVGAVLLNPDDPSKMLVVQEKTGPAAAYRLWKMPTGLLDPGEDIPEAASRELLEETGLQGTIDGIICFRQAHSPSRSSDLFFVCRVRLDHPDQSWTIQEEEIADIQWMSVEDYCGQDRWQGSPVYETINESIRKISVLEMEKQQEEKKGGPGSSTRTRGSATDAGNADKARGRGGLILHEQLPLGFADTTNAVFRSQL